MRVQRCGISHNVIVPERTSEPKKVLAGLIGLRVRATPEFRSEQIFLKGFRFQMNDIEVSTKELAGAFGVSDRTVRDLAERGVIRKAGRGRYQLLDCTKSYTGHLREVAAARGGEGGVLDLVQERARLAREQADGQELKNRQARKELVPAADVEREWSDILRKVRAGILAVTSRVRASAGLTAEQAVDMDSELRLALKELGDDHEYPPGGPSCADPADATPAVGMDRS